MAESSNPILHREVVRKLVVWEIARLMSAAHTDVADALAYPTKRAAWSLSGDRMKSPREITLAMEFQRRRRHWLVVMCPSAALFFGGVFMATIFPTFPRWLVYVASGLGLLGWFLANTVAKYRCPRCDKVPNGADGTLVNPKSCPTCNLQFR